MKKTREINELGYEITFATNYIGHFLLTNLLLDILKSSAPSRIINVTSGSHKRGKLDFNDLSLNTLSRLAAIGFPDNSSVSGALENIKTKIHSNYVGEEIYYIFGIPPE